MKEWKLDVWAIIIKAIVILVVTLLLHFTTLGLIFYNRVNKHFLNIVNILGSVGSEQNQSYYVGIYINMQNVHLKCF